MTTRAQLLLKRAEEHLRKGHSAMDLLTCSEGGSVFEQARICAGPRTPAGTVADLLRVILLKLLKTRSNFTRAKLVSAEYTCAAAAQQAFRVMLHKNGARSSGAAVLAGEILACVNEFAFEAMDERVSALERAMQQKDEPQAGPTPTPCVANSVRDSARAVALGEIGLQLLQKLGVVTPEQVTGVMQYAELSACQAGKRLAAELSDVAAKKHRASITSTTTAASSRT